MTAEDELSTVILEFGSSSFMVVENSFHPGLITAFAVILYSLADLPEAANDQLTIFTPVLSCEKDENENVRKRHASRGTQ
jgi:hypothetical protein